MPTPTAPAASTASSGWTGRKKRRGEAQLDAAAALDGNVLTVGGVDRALEPRTGQLCCTALNLLPSDNRDLTLITNPDLLRFWKAGGFVQDRQTLCGRVHLTLGVRIDAQAAIGSAAARAHRQPARGAGGRALDRGQPARAVRPGLPRAQRVRAAVDARPAARSTMNAYEVGYAQAIGPFFLQSSVYLDQVDNAILANPFASRPGSARLHQRRRPNRRGVEEWFQLRLPRLRAFGFYSYVRREPFLRSPSPGCGRAASGCRPTSSPLGASVDVYRTLFLSVYDVWNSAVDDVATSVTGAGVEVLRLPYFNEPVADPRRPRPRHRGRPLRRFSLNLDNLLDRDNLRPNIRGSDPRVFVQNHISAMFTLRMHL